MAKYYIDFRKYNYNTYEDYLHALMWHGQDCLPWLTITDECWIDGSIQDVIAYVEANIKTHWEQAAYVHRSDGIYAACYQWLSDDDLEELERDEFPYSREAIKTENGYYLPWDISKYVKE